MASKTGAAKSSRHAAAAERVSVGRCKLGRPDPADERIARLRAEESIRKLAAELDEENLGLRICPLDLLPDKTCLTSSSRSAAVALIPDRSEVWLGVRSDTPLVCALLEVSRMLAHLRDFPLLEERPQIMPLLEAYCHGIVAQLVGHSYVGAAFRGMQKHLSYNRPGAHDRLAERLWALLTVLDPYERERVLSSFAKIDPEIRAEVEGMIQRIGARPPTSAHEAELMLAELHPEAAADS